MRATDLIQVARFWQSRGYRVAVAAPDRHGWPVLLAAAVEPQAISACLVALPFNSLRQLLDEGGDAALCDVPGMLSDFDAPDIAGLTAPRGLWVACSADPEPWETARRAYRAAGRSASFRVVPPTTPTKLLSAWAEAMDAEGSSTR